MPSSARLKRFDRAVHEMRDISDPLRRLEAVRRSLQALEELQAATVLEARKSGATWIEIGAMYGLTKQGAQQKFRRSTAKHKAAADGQLPDPAQR